MKRALVLGSGGLSGAYDAGVAATLCRELKSGYFHSIYASSVGVYAAMFFAANQPDIIEEVWRNHVHGLQLVNPFNLWRKPILGLSYLHKLFTKPPFMLDTRVIMNGTTRICFVATDCTLHRPTYFTPKQEEEILLFGRASAAVPFMHPSVEIQGRMYNDGCLTDLLPVQKALDDRHDGVIVISNKHPYHLRSLRNMRPSYHKRWHRIEEVLGGDSRVKVIRPKSKLPGFLNFDSRKQRINQLVDLGISDALAFLH